MPTLQRVPLNPGRLLLSGACMLQLAQVLNYSRRWRSDVYFNLSHAAGQILSSSHCSTANLADSRGRFAAAQAFLIHTELAGEYAMRMAIGATHTQRRHIDAAWAVIQQQAAAQLEKLQAAGQAN